jgi:hypothetical protein
VRASCGEFERLEKHLLISDIHVIFSFHGNSRPGRKSIFVWISDPYSQRIMFFALTYSVRNACMGSRRDARQAGTVQASVATSSNIAATAAKTAGSSGWVS